MAPIDNYRSENNYITAFDGTLNIISICSIVLMTVGVLGIKFKWFRARMTFGNKEPTNRNAIVGVYKQNLDNEFSNYSETSTSSMYTSVDHSDTPIQKSEPKTFQTKDERINNKYFNTSITKVNFHDVLTELNSIKPSATTSKNDFDDSDSGYLNEINSPSYFETHNEYLTVLDNDLPPELPKSDPPKFDEILDTSYLDLRPSMVQDYDQPQEDVEFYLLKSSPRPLKSPKKKKLAPRVEFEFEVEEIPKTPTFEFVRKSNQSLIVNQNDLSEQYSTTAANIFLQNAIKNSPGFNKRTTKPSGGKSPAFNKRSESKKNESTILSNPQTFKMNSNDDNLSISSDTSA